MTERDDHLRDMADAPFDEHAADALLSGARPPADGRLAPVAELLDELRATTTEPPAPPSPALAAVLRNGLPADPAGAAPVPGRRDRRSARLGWRRVVAPIGVGLTLTAGSLTAAAAGDVLPDAAQRVVAGVVNAITPLELPRPARGERLPAGPDDADPGSRPGAPAGGGQADRDERPSATAPAGASPGQAPATGGATPSRVPGSPGATSLSPPNLGPEAFPGPPGAPSAGTPSVPLPGAPAEAPGSLPLPVTPPTVGTPNVTAPPTTALTPPTSVPSALPPP